MILDHFASTELVFDRARIYTQDHPFKPNGLWVSVRGDDDWETWCNDNNFYGPGNALRHEVTPSTDANIHHITTPNELQRFYDEWHIPDDRYPPGRYRELFPDYIDWAEFTKTCDGIIIAPYQWSLRLGHLWYSGWDCASGCIWNLAAIATVDRVDTESMT